MGVFAIIAVRDEARYLPGYLRHIREHVDGIVALDDCSIDRTAEILAGEPKVLSILREDRRGPPHANETRNRYRMLAEAARLNARWVLCCDADERFDTAFLGRVRREAEKGERTGRPIREVRLVNLWNSRDHYRADGRCGPRWAPRMFRVPAEFSERPFAMHRPWFPPELDTAPRAYMNAYLYHLRMIAREDRERRYAKFRAIDSDNAQQQVGYAHLIDEGDLRLKPVLPWRGYADGGEGAPATPDEFDELFYLNQNLDVQRAVAAGEVASGWAHFARSGAGEGRPWRKKARLLGLDFGAILGAWRKRNS
jgi:glycosyltransferase involved in cell wall biosynthesis